MAPRDELPILEPADGRAWERWLEGHHADPGRLAEAGQEGSGRTQLIAGKRMRRSRGLPAGTGPRPPPPGPSSRPWPAWAATGSCTGSATPGGRRRGCGGSGTTWRCWARGGRCG